tara:strand:+ start:23137 stop:24096 length:960 start_codon:yes stop_codon:yes gene_type:complete
VALISVVIPAYRPEDFSCLLQSMANNTDPIVEWIVVDDGSGPQFDEVFATLPATVMLIRQAANQRQGAARNVGLAAASGQWVKFLDADDQLDNGHLSALYSSIHTDRVRVLPFAPTLHVYPSGKTMLNDSWRDLPVESSAQFRRQLVRPFVHHCGVLFPRKLLLQLGGYDENLVTDEDGDLLLRVLRQGYYFKPVESINYLYIHRLGGGRVSSDDDISKFQARVTVCRKVLGSYSNGIPVLEAEALAQRMDQIALSYWKSYPLEARKLLTEARSIAPDYKADARALFKLMRRVVGVGPSLSLIAAYRRLRGRPAGGAQG